MWRVLIPIAVLACGRIAFEPRDTRDPRDDGPNLPRCDVRKAAAGRQFTCAINAAGVVWCWGLNDHGQVVAGGPRHVPAGAPIELPKAALEIGAGREFACARLVDDSVWCWGDTTHGQAGGSVAASPSLPVEVPLGGERAIELGVGGQYACIRRASDQAIVCWGENKFDALGTAGGGILPPTAIPGTAGTRRLALGHRHNCAIDAAMRAVCWGRGNNGQLGTGELTDRAAPLPAIATPVDGVAAAARFTCAIEAGSARCWGDNGAGQLGDGTFIHRTTPGPVVTTGALDIALSTGGACAVRAGGQVTCWGAPWGDGVDEAIPIPHDLALPEATAIIAGPHHFCALTTAGLSCWGADTDGELGRGTRGIALPTPITLPAGAAGIAVGTWSAACAIAGGEVFCWGANGLGQLGDATRRASATPKRVGLSLSAIEGITGGGNHFCAWGAGAGACWGLNTNGQLGDSSAAQRLGPVMVGVAGITTMAGGRYYTCAATASDVRCWGRNDFGQLGNGTTFSSLTPTIATGVGAATSLAASDGHTCAVTAGTLRCWGSNSDGQLGDGTTTNRTSPVVVGLPGTANSVVTGFAHTCAMTTAGNVYCWGANDSGQVGDGTTTRRTSPTAVNLPAAAVELTATGGFSKRGLSCARLTTGAVTCWGSGDSGGRGDHTFDDALLPREAPALAGASRIVQGRTGGCAILSGGVACWGEALLAGGDPWPAMAAPIAIDCTP